MAEFTPTDDLRDLRAVFSRDVALTAPERAVMGVLILHRNGESGRCDPSVSLMASETNLGRSTVLRSLASLESAGWISREQRHGVRTRYTVTSTTAGLVPQRDQSQSGTGVVPQRDQSQSGTGVVPQRDGTRPTAGPERTKERTKERTDALWTAFVDEMDGDRLTLTTTRRKKLAALHTEQLRDQPDPVASFRQILRAVKRSDHHMGNRDYQMPESLFKNPERRETWAEKGRTNGSGGSTTDPLLMSAAELRKREEA